MIVLIYGERKEYINIYNIGVRRGSIIYNIRYIEYKGYIK